MRLSDEDRATLAMVGVATGLVVGVLVLVIDNVVLDLGVWVTAVFGGGGIGLAMSSWYQLDNHRNGLLYPAESDDEPEDSSPVT